MKDINLIRKIAWEFHYKTGICYEELFSEAVLQYLEAEKNFEPKRIGKSKKKSSYFWNYLKNNMINFCIKHKKEVYDSEFIKEQSTSPLPFFELYDGLPENCKKITDVVLTNRYNLIGLPPKKARGKVVKLLREQGWAWSKIWLSINDLKKALNETPENCIIYNK